MFKINLGAKNSYIVDNKILNVYKENPNTSNGDDTSKSSTKDKNEEFVNNFQGLERVIEYRKLADFERYKNIVKFYFPNIPDDQPDK